MASREPGVPFAPTGSVAPVTPAAPVHATPAETVLEALEAKSQAGLDCVEAQRRLRLHGPNRLPEGKRKGDLRRLAEQFANPLVLTLLFAAAVAVYVGLLAESEGSWLERWGDALAILLIVSLNALLGFFQERRAEATLAALSKLSAPTARVRRGGTLEVLPADQLVPGDWVELEAGDAIPADLRLLQTTDFATEEAALTGESTASRKDARAQLPADAPLGDRSNLAFSGTTALRGKAVAVVTATGMHTELGRIGRLLEGIGSSKTPLEQKLEGFGKRILQACLLLSALLLGWGLYRGGRPWSSLLLEAVSLAVAAIPEGLPAITTITLALGMQRMAKRGAIVRRLAAVETLGAATVIASDKTGTLTQNAMVVRRLWLDGEELQVSGEGYETTGDLRDAAGHRVTEPPALLRELLETSASCNDAQLRRNPDTGLLEVLGDPTEAALLTLAGKGGIEREALRALAPVLEELPFDSDRKRMAVLVEHARDGQPSRTLHVKGSVDGLLPLCVSVRGKEGPRALDASARRAILDAAEALSKSALRVLAICQRRDVPPEVHGPALEAELTFLGLVGMMDPPRPGVRESIALCNKAGIRPIMITGDHPATAVAIAREIGMWQEGDASISGSELAGLTDAELEARALELRVYARTTAEQKLRIVRALKARGQVVAMTGDGVNDAPALREAHIGVAMGRSGTDVARQAADLVLADDDFSTIVEAVREGRAIYGNIQKFIFFLLSSNMGLLVAVFAVALTSSWLPLTPLMILWINLVTNGLPALALGVDPPDAGLMDEAPRRQGEGLLSPPDYASIAFVGVWMGAMALLLYATASTASTTATATDAEALSLAEGLGGQQARAMAFHLLALAPLAHAWGSRSTTRTLFGLRPRLSLPLLGATLASLGIHLVTVLVPGLRPVFDTFPLNLGQLGLLLGLSVGCLGAYELWKGLRRSALASGA